MWHVAAQTIVEPNQAQLCYPDVNIVSSTSKSKLTEKNPHSQSLFMKISELDIHHKQFDHSF